MFRCYVLLIALFVGACQAGKEGSGPLVEPVSMLYNSADKPFYHGVASGDPLEDAVILWTRLTPDDSTASIPVRWEISENERFEPVVREGRTKTSPERDYTVKVDVDGLQPGTYYYYRFTALDATSPIGRTKTAPRGDVDSLKFAVVSCANWQHGYFSAYDRIAEKELDAVVHLGDYIYEYGIGSGNNVRPHLPEHEIVTLSDYRTRYSQYHLDPSLRHLRMKHPLITIWDDHEVANNSYIAGAQNHQPEEEGDYEARKAAARQAYYEWLPIRESETLYRSFRFGSLADLIMLDERLEGKTAPAKGIDDPQLGHDDRSMLGDAQRTWLEQQLARNTVTWKVIGNQVVFSDLDRSTVHPRSPRNMDSWDGYPADKARVAEIIRKNEVDNVVFLTGDTHASWAFEVVAAEAGTPFRADYDAVAIEFGTPSVSSNNSNEALPDDTVKLREQRYLQTNPHLKFVNQRDHGYVLLTLSPTAARADWYYVGSVKQPDASETKARSFTVATNSTRLE